MLTEVLLLTSDVAIWTIVLFFFFFSHNLEGFQKRAPFLLLSKKIS